jgi:hypothetical protein
MAKGLENMVENGMDGSPKKKRGGRVGGKERVRRRGKKEG